MALIEMNCILVKPTETLPHPFLPSVLSGPIVVLGFFGKFVPKRLVNILAFTCLINSLPDPVRVILIPDYFKTLAQSVICR